MVAIQYPIVQSADVNWQYWQDLFEWLRTEVLKYFSNGLGWLRQYEVPKYILGSLIAWNDFTRRHPYLCGIALILNTDLISIFLFLLSMVFNLLLLAIGFGIRGIRGGSLASLYQSGHYTSGTGGIPAGSHFARAQSSGAKMSWGVGLSCGGAYFTLIRICLACYGEYILSRHFGGW